MLAGRSIVVCRATHQAGELLDRLASLGAEPLHVPVIDVAPPADGGAALRAALADAGDSTWLALTSANGVDAVDRALAGAVPACPVAVVGEATARRAAARGWPVAFVSPVAAAAGLGAHLPFEPGRQVIAPLAELASDDLAEQLRARGFVVLVIAAYRTTAPPVTPENRRAVVGADAVVVSSPSIIDRLVSVVDPTDLPPLVAIGPTSALAIDRHGLTAAATANEPTVDGLIDALVRTLQS